MRVQCQNWGRKIARARRRSVRKVGHGSEGGFRAGLEAAEEESYSAWAGAVRALTKHRRYIGIPQMRALGARPRGFGDGWLGVAGRMLEPCGGFE
jgi:hypothetical protein